METDAEGGEYCRMSGLSNAGLTGLSSIESVEFAVINAAVGLASGHGYRTHHRELRLGYDIFSTVTACQMLQAGALSDGPAL